MGFGDSYNAVYGDEKVDFFDLSHRFPRNRTEALVWLTPAAETVLEIGFGNGNAIYNLRNRAERLFGVEVSDKRCTKVQAKLEAAQINGKCMVGNIEEGLDFPNHYFDVIIWADVIEHVVDLWKAMGEINRLLKIGGSLVTITPNVAYIKRRWMLLMGKFPSTSGSDEGLGVRPGEMFDGGHLHYFTFSSLEKLYKKYGLRPKLCLGYGPLGKFHNFLPRLLSNSLGLVGEKVTDFDFPIACK